ncbi:peptidoglycan editing factor PgeF [Niveispirillum sp.]|uniref:peptidoglycan editing factor PgeF n=1 Tax=Niveispirillum sp. TaxID=1917217 RepID=UPI001B3FB47F|nr:peptidoglycan editing factor PgeF [Niveispirillum sp.]MBP7338325.1 peptidoglycan editing factor PgeF [Niveispirillum sp.]
MITLDHLSAVPGLRHGFFTRTDGVSSGILAAMNCGYGSNDDPANVTANRARAMELLGVPAPALTTVYQVHSPDVVTVTEPFPHSAAPKADALVTDRPGIALGILTADCVPVLFVDPVARVIGASHAGWKGAVMGVLEATVDAMLALGAQRDRILAGIGPHIGWDSYEVGPEFRDRFLTLDTGHASLFRPSTRADHWMFDIGGYVAGRLRAAGIGQVETTGLDTLAREDLFFSYRRACLRQEPDYGRGLSAICLE